MGVERDRFREKNPEAYRQQELQSGNDLKRISVIATVATVLVATSLYLTKPEFAEKVDKIPGVTADVVLKTLTLLGEGASYVRN